MSEVVSQQPMLDRAERVEYDRICKRVDRAEGDKRRAEKRGDAKKLAAAERALARSTAARTAFLHPHVGHIWAPTRILAKFEARWSGPTASGTHVHECEMVLDHKDLSGPQYVTTRVLKDEGGPPPSLCTPHNPPNAMGVAWFALGDHIAKGKITVLDAAVPA